jgi:hypothetical protein
MSSNWFKLAMKAIKVKYGKNLLLKEILSGNQARTIKKLKQSNKV